MFFAFEDKVNIREKKFVYVIPSLHPKKKRRKEGKKGWREEGKEGRKDGGKKGMKELILFENILDEAITIIFSFKLNLTF